MVHVILWSPGQPGYEGFEDATIEQGKQMNHEPVYEEPIDASDANRTQGAFRNGRCSQDTNTVSSWSSLSTPPKNDDEQDRISYDKGNKLKSLVALDESPTLNDVPRRLSPSATAKDRRGFAPQTGAVHGQMKESPNKTAGGKEQQVMFIVAGLGSPAVMTMIQDSMDYPQGYPTEAGFASVTSPTVILPSVTDRDHPNPRTLGCQEVFFHASRCWEDSVFLSSEDSDDDDDQSASQTISASSTSSVAIPAVCTGLASKGAGNGLLGAMVGAGAVLLL